LNRQSASESDTETLWKSEVDTLNAIRELPHTDHLIRGIAAISRNKRHYILFEWADGGNLRDFWTYNPSPVANDKTIMEFVEQMSGLSSGLATLHGDVHFRHGDLKPDNILVFHNPSTWLGTLKITDFATSRHHNVRTALRAQPTIARFGTAQYEAPEAATERRQPRSRLFDVWSMGCIMLESIIWLLYGLEGLEAFHNGDFKLSRESNFYTITSPSTAVVSQRVSTWTEAILQLDPECNNSSGSALEDFIRLVRDRLLVVDLPSVDVEQQNKLAGVPSIRLNAHQLEENLARTRINSAELSEELSRIHQKALHNPEYLFAGLRHYGERHSSSILREVQRNVQRATNLTNRGPLSLGAIMVRFPHPSEPLTISKTDLE
jgi:serine/threonine protein kinase